MDQLVESQGSRWVEECGAGSGEWGVGSGEWGVLSGGQGAGREHGIGRTRTLEAVLLLAALLAYLLLSIVCSCSVAAIAFPYLEGTTFLIWQAAGLRFARHIGSR